MIDCIIDVEQWAKDKGIDKATSLLPQTLKVIEEIGEVAECISKNKIDKLQDEIGDVAITLIILSLQAGFEFEQCVKVAYDKIQNRTGKVVNGVFIKDKSYDK